MFGGSFAPAGWMYCAGQLLPISENETLFQLIGTTYGGDGQSTFALPDLQGRIPVHAGSTLNPIGMQGGTESVTLTTQQIPIHTHAFLCSGNNADATQPTNNVAGVILTPGVTAYGTDAPPVNLNTNTVSIIGGSQPHDNMQPFLCVSFIISLFGIFPPPS
jgi:microcystin-dependent protein